MLFGIDATGWECKTSFWKFKGQLVDITGLFPHLPSLHWDRGISTTRHLLEPLAFFDSDSGRW